MAALARLQQRALQAENMIIALRNQLSKLSEDAVVAACKQEEAALTQENSQLRAEVAKMKETLCVAEAANGVTQVPLPSANQSKPVTPASTPVTPAPAVPTPAAHPTPPAPAATAAPMVNGDQPVPKKEKKGAKPKAAPKEAAAELPVDVSRLDMRIGKIVGVKRHPDADALYVEDVDLGEAKTRTIVSGLVNHVPIEQMSDRVAVFMCNLKPAKMRGVLSEGMIMCGSTPEKVEIIEPPAGAAVGERVWVEGYEAQPDPQLNPKKKVWEQVQPDLRISECGVASYRGGSWRVAQREGQCTVPSLKDVMIK